ncbi:MAG: kynureninase, partial [Acidobacteriota bacterium]|nr:kynureninase [Acidobacteriota bacterium]
DDKWQYAYAAADRVRAGYRRLLDDPTGRYSLAAATHDLLVKLISSLPLWDRAGRRSRRHLVTTDREFHALERQLRRLEEEGIEVTRVAAHPAENVGERLAAAITDSTAAVLVSTVFFSSGHIAGDLSTAAEACRKHGAILVLDTYHQLNIVPFSLRERGLEDSFVVSAGYKYCQLGEGNAFLRFPNDCDMRPVATGWFANFGELSLAQRDGPVGYDSGDDRFAGATYDPTSHYRGAEVFEFFNEQQLTPPLLRRINQHQLSRLANRFDDLDLDPRVLQRDRSVGIENLGGFLCLESVDAAEIWSELEKRGVFSDSRDRSLRLGPAPYLSDEQLDRSIDILGEVVGRKS